MGVNKKIESKKSGRGIDIFCFVSDSKIEMIQDLLGVGSKGKKDARKVLMEHCENKAVTENPHPKEDSFVTNDNDSMNVETRVLDDLEVPLDPLDNIIEGNLGFDEEVLTVEEREAFLYGARVNSEYVVEDEFLSSHNKEDEILLLDDYEILHVDDDIYGFRVETKLEPEDQESDRYFSDKVSEVASFDPSIQLYTVEIKTLSGKCMSVDRSLFQRILESKISKIFPKSGTKERLVTFQDTADMPKTPKRQNSTLKPKSKMKRKRSRGI